VVWIGDHNRTLHVVKPMVRGQMLAQWMQQDYSQDQVDYIVHQLRQFVSYLHGSGITHCDITIETVFVTARLSVEVESYSHVNTRSKEHDWLAVDHISRSLQTNSVSNFSQAYYCLVKARLLQIWSGKRKHFSQKAHKINSFIVSRILSEKR
jgi:serine/threonine protein kinase